MLGPRFERIRYSQNGVTVARGYYLFFGFYWFAFAFLNKWPHEFVDGYASGLLFSCRPNPRLGEGDLMWTVNKKWLRFYRQGEF